MKSKCGIRNAACSSAQAIFTNSNPPRLLCSLPSLQELTSPFLLSLAAELSSHFHLSQSQQDGRMLGRADRGEQTWLDKLVIVEPHHHRRRRRRRPALSAPYPILLCHSVIPFISSNLSSTPFLSSPPPPPRAPASPLCITYGLAAGSAAVLETAWGLRSHLVLSRAKPSFRKAS